MIGERFGRLTVIAASPARNGPRWECRCDCGKTRVVQGFNLRSGTSTSCGCSRSKPRATLSDRLWRKVVVASSGCWEWTGSGNQKGYGHISNGSDGGNVLIRAHRAAWLLTHFVIPEGMQVLHRCDNRRCVNPEHLFLGTHQDNMDDMTSKGRGRCEGAPGAMNSMAKLTDVAVAQIRRDFSSGRTRRELAEEHGVTQSNIGCIVRGSSWRHVGGSS